MALVKVANRLGQDRIAIHLQCVKYIVHSTCNKEQHIKKKKERKKERKKKHTKISLNIDVKLNNSQ